MKAAYDVGCNFFDCAETNAEGESEKIIGETIKKYGWKRNDLVISTKVSVYTVCLSYTQLSPAHRFIGARVSVTTAPITSACRASTSLKA